MDPAVASSAAVTRKPQVIELVIEETVQYELTWGLTIKTSKHVLTSKATSQVQLTQNSRKSRSTRPVARVCPSIRERKRSESTENELQAQTKVDYTQPDEDLKVLAPSEEIDEILGKFSEGKEEELLRTERYITIESAKDRSEVEEPTPLTEDNYQEKQERDTDSKHIAEFPERYLYPNRDPCGCHRDWIRENKHYQRKRPNYSHCYCQARMECGNDGCHMENKEEQHHKETSITDCLEEFLASLHLGHLLDYFKVLGCMCVRDLRLLELSELEAIQLISRRRLLQQLDSITLHHEAPPADCSLEAWLTWYGLTHISGFLAAIGVHSVGDLGYLKEDDLQLLKPVTRRRILTCKAKYREKGRMTQSGQIKNDYLM